MTIEEWKTDWRNCGQEDFLLGVTLYHRKYKAPSERWNHDHCDFCWLRFSDDVETDLHEGYTTADNYYWICSECFHDLKDFFCWKVIDECTSKG